MEERTRPLIDFPFSPMVVENKGGYVNLAGSLSGMQRAKSAAFPVELEVPGKIDIWENRLVAIQCCGLVFLLVLIANTVSEASASEPSAPYPYPIQIEQRYGLVNSQGQLVLPPILEEIGEFAADSWAPAKQDGLWGFVDHTGQFVIAPRFLEVGKFGDNGLAPARNTDPDYADPDKARIFSGAGWGYIDRAGQWRIPPQFEQAEPFGVSSLAAAKQGGRWGYIDDQGRWAIAPRFLRARAFQKTGLAAVEEDGKWGLLNRQGEWLVPPRYQALHHDDRLGELSLFRDDSGWGFLADGQVVIPPRFQSVKGFHQDRWAPVKLDGKWGYIDRRGEIVIPPQFDDASGFVADHAVVKIAGKFGYIDRNGELAIPANFSDGETFTLEGRAAVKDSEGWGIVNRQGKWLVAPRFGSIDRRSLAEGRLTGVVEQGFATWMDNDGRILSLRHHCGTTVVRDFDSKRIWPPDLDQRCARYRAGENPQAAAMADYMADQLAWNAVRQPVVFVPLADMRKTFENLRSPVARQELAPQMDKITQSHQGILDWLHKTGRMAQALSAEGLSFDFAAEGVKNMSEEDAEGVAFGMEILNGHHCGIGFCRMRLQVQQDRQGNLVLVILELKAIE